MQAYREARGRIIAVYEDEFGWNQMEADTIQAIKECYTQKMVDALIQFHRSPSGSKLLAQTRGDDAVQEAIADDMKSAMIPENDGESRFFESEIGKEIIFAAAQVAQQMQRPLQAREFVAAERVRPIIIELNARLDAAK